ncbi:MAG: hypothetical protein ACRDYY_08040 [Acidimicrobiales bacterium]
MANQPHSRYRLAGPIVFPHRGDEVAAQTEQGSVRYDIGFDAEKDRWCLDASWKTETGSHRSLDEPRQTPVLAVDVNAGHLAGWVINPDGNPVGAPISVPLNLAGLSSNTRDGRLRAAVAELVVTARGHRCRAFVIENLGFDSVCPSQRTGNRETRRPKGIPNQAVGPDRPEDHHPPTRRPKTVLF